MINYKKAGQRICAQRKRLGLTQEIVAEKISITPSFYSQIESGDRKASIKTFVNISNVLSISLDYIFDNHVDFISTDIFDDIEYKIFHYVKNFSAKEKEFVLDVIISLDNFIT